MAVESWIDAVAEVWDAVADGRGGQARSYRVFEKAEFPSSIAEYPSVITYVVEVETQYSLGGPLIDSWRGVSEFHLFPNADKSNFPAIMRYFARIRDAAAARMTLGGRVAHFLLRTGEGPSVQGPVVLQYGSEDPHHGLLVHWIVKENVSGSYTPAA